MKKIIGYKAPFTIYEGISSQINKGDVLVRMFTGLYYGKKEWERNGDFGLYYIAKEIVETWEPIYEELLVNTWVITEENNLDRKEHEEQLGCIVRHSNSNHPYRVQFASDPNLLLYCKARAATNEEIKNQLKKDTWVTIIENKSGSMLSIGHVGQVEGYGSGKTVLVTAEGKTTSEARFSLLADLRLATSAEIEKAKLACKPNQIVLGSVGSNGLAITVKKDSIHINGKGTVFISEIYDLYKRLQAVDNSHLQAWPVQLAVDLRYIQVGCWEERNLFSVQEIQQILAAADSL